MMILTFQELGINAAMFNGMSAVQAIKEIVNIAADAITMARYQHPVTAIETLYKWEATRVDFITQRVEIPARDFDSYAIINT